MQRWSIRDARIHLSRLVHAARQEPQVITKRGRDTVVVLSRQEYDLLVRREPLSRFFARVFAGLEINRIKAAMRDEGEL